jgi:hypothetical protein
MDAKHKEEEISQTLRTVFDIITIRFTPAKNETENQYYFNTVHLLQKICQLYNGEDVTINNIHALMTDAGFKISIDSEMNFYYLMKDK